MIHRLFENNTILNQYIAEIRDVKIQKDRMRFRHNLRRIGEICAYEISKGLEYTNRQVETPLGIAKCMLPDEKIILATILRAGLPLHNGLLSYFDKADNAFISAYRKHRADGTFEIYMNYITCPDITDTIVILSDPMLASGASMRQSIDALLEYGKPKEIHCVIAIAATQGIEYITKHYPNIHLWIATEDAELNSKSYIIPGLGDAGDLAFGAKLQA